MKQLPALLAPWRPWLSLFPEDLALPLGELMLRLDPQIGPLRSAPARADKLPEGIGSIVTRGPYERMLITEWAYADAEPDEFIRRAASGELMFTGPEPAARQRSRRCIALFDAGPAQLGEPRLLHLALFILLARRAEEAGARFEWGVLQSPSTLHGDSGKEGLRRLLAARTLWGATEPVQWPDDTDSSMDDLWIVGGHALQAPRGTRGQIAIRHSMLGEQLDVQVKLQGSVRSVTLDLPAHALGTRLLRAPFEAVASLARKRDAKGQPSLGVAPRFAVHGRRIAIAQSDHGIMVYHIPESLKTEPGKAQQYKKMPTGVALGIGVFGKSLVRIVREDNALALVNFPSPAFRSDREGHSELPDLERFRATPTATRWLHVFFIKLDRADSQGQGEDGHILSLDLAGNLGWWSARFSPNLAKKTSTPLFRLLAKAVLGACQFDLTVRYGCARESTTEIFDWTPADGSTAVLTIPHTGTRLCFGKAPNWYGGGRRALIALQRTETSWFVGDSVDWISVDLESGATVLGVAACSRYATWGLVIRSADKMSIDLRGKERHQLVTSPEAIAQASLDPNAGLIGWICTTSLSVYVQGINESKPYLHVITEKADDAT
jgi:hypothetical protein